jgi:hypothetical protein
MLNASHNANPPAATNVVNHVVSSGFDNPPFNTTHAAFPAFNPVRAACIKLKYAFASVAGFQKFNSKPKAAVSPRRRFWKPDEAISWGGYTEDQVEERAAECRVKWSEKMEQNRRSADSRQEVTLVTSKDLFGPAAYP